MKILRRGGNLVSLALLCAILGAQPCSIAQVAPSALSPAANQPGTPYGLIGKIKVKPGQRDALAAILVQATSAMPGCLSYIVAGDAQDADALWITEVWDSKASHQASLALPAIKQAIQAGRPMIAGFGERFETRPVGGFGLKLP